MHSSRAVAALVTQLQAAPVLFLLLDYDGTLVPFAPTPELAEPDDELICLLRRLATRPSTEVHVVSGRPRETLKRWLGALPIGLHAEHGFSSRMPGASTWTAGVAPSPDWRPAVLALMQTFAERTSGAFVEDKSVGLAWHYRLADPHVGPARARALRSELTLLLRSSPAEILPGAKVVEVVARGVHKGRLVPSFLARAPAGALIVALGDDRTDEDLFAALPPGALAVHVGPEPSQASIRLAGVPQVRALLRAVADAPPL
ncbi:MAG TPA: trehalose-phosphatase [Methylomirabilota bacterium]|jgi:trehalose 6-phosphate synthase/phosphatase|nr:trehalose-phosphatase [Methylomirabilota bacterium]